tara:strand:- start:381 stop:548 length:168 start_codon:yes stop_codon:yes gene_type:complete
MNKKTVTYKINPSRWNKKLYLSKVNAIELASNIVYLLDSNINVNDHTNPIKKVEL